MRPGHILAPREGREHAELHSRPGVSCWTSINHIYYARSVRPENYARKQIGNYPENTVMLQMIFEG